MNVRQYLDLYWEQQGAVDRWDARNDMVVRFQYDADDGLVYIEFLETLRKAYGKPQQYKQIAIETCARSALRVQFTNIKHTGGYDKAVAELWNPKAGVDTVELIYQPKIETVSSAVGEWPNKQYEERSWIVTQLKCGVKMFADGKLHHNYKPAAFNGSNGNWDSICFYKQGKLCIPPEQPFPSSITRTSRNVMIRDRKSRVVLEPSSLLEKIYCRVPKTRWDALNSARSILKKHDSLIESWTWDDKVIPEELFSMFEYPLDDVAMFTIMMAV